MKTNLPLLTFIRDVMMTYLIEMDEDEKFRK